MTSPAISPPPTSSHPSSTNAPRRRLLTPHSQQAAEQSTSSADGMVQKLLIGRRQNLALISLHQHIGYITQYYYKATAYNLPSTPNSKASPQQHMKMSSRVTIRGRYYQPSTISLHLIHPSTMDTPQGRTQRSQRRTHTGPSTLTFQHSRQSRSLCSMRGRGGGGCTANMRSSRHSIGQFIHHSAAGCTSKPTSAPQQTTNAS